MGLLDKLFKKDRNTFFVFDAMEKQYKAELNGITFICEEPQEEYAPYAVDLANNYEAKLSDIYRIYACGYSEYVWGERQGDD